MVPPPRRPFLMAAAALLVVPLVAGAQQPRKPWRIGYLAHASSMVGPDTLGEFKRQLAQLGYAEGQQYVVEVRDAEGPPERLNQLAAELVALRVDVIVGTSTPPSLAAMRATRTIPIVFGVAADPVGSGLVKNLAQPGGNVTGSALAFEEVSAKWLEFLQLVRGRLARVTVISNPSNESMSVMLDPLGASARAMKIALTVRGIAPSSDLDAVLDAVRKDSPDGLIVLPDGFIRTRVPRIVELTTQMRLPAIYGNWPYVEAGGLMSYGSDQREGFRRAAVYVDKILKGAKPADLPVERPTKFELVISLRSARAHGLTIPPSLLSRADRVIE